jgi:hypothetical protein
MGRRGLLPARWENAPLIFFDDQPGNFDGFEGVCSCGLALLVPVPSKHAPLSAEVRGLLSGAPDDLVEDLFDAGDRCGIDDTTLDQLLAAARRGQIPYIVFDFDRTLSVAAGLSSQRNLYQDADADFVVGVMGGRKRYQRVKELLRLLAKLKRGEVLTAQPSSTYVKMVLKSMGVRGMPVFSQSEMGAARSKPGKVRSLHAWECTACDKSAS